MFPVDVRYQDHGDERPVTDQAADAVEAIVNTGESGDILVFMPGMGEINATTAAIRAARTHERLAVIPLHGDLPPEQQDLAFAPNPNRKVIVATNVAERSRAPHHAALSCDLLRQRYAAVEFLRLRILNSVRSLA